MSRFNIFDLPANIKEGLQPFKLDFMKNEDEDDMNISESESSSGSSSESEDEVTTPKTDAETARARYKPAKATFSSAVTKYDADEEESMEQWQWANRAHITGTPYVYFTNKNSIPAAKVLALYKSWFNAERMETEPVKEVLNLPRDGKSCILMVGSGHFAATIISHKNHKHKTNLSNPGANVNVLKSKTFHRYTTRRKQGGAQSASDAARGKANSAGSTIRRANERMLQEEIKELLSSWSDELKDCFRIFYRAPGRSNKQLLAGYPNAPISNDDERLTRIPFASGRPTLNECKSAWMQLTQANIVDAPKPPQIPTGSASPAANSRQASRQVSPAPPPVEEKEEDPAVAITSKLTDLIKRSKLPAIKSLIQNECNGDFDFNLAPESKYLAFPTPLLYAAHHDKHNVVSQFLQWGANPLIKNGNGQTLGEIASNHKKTKEALQTTRHAMGEDKWDWKQAKIASPISRDQLLAKETAEKLKIRQENAEMEAEQDKQERHRRMEKMISKHGTGKLTGGHYEASRGLSEDDLKQVERERRARAAEARLARFSNK